MSGSIRYAFDRAMREGCAANSKETPQESDSDSEKEAEKVAKRKRQKKRPQGI